MEPTIPARKSFLSPIINITRNNSLWWIANSLHLLPNSYRLLQLLLTPLNLSSPYYNSNRCHTHLLSFCKMMKICLWELAKVVTQVLWKTLHWARVTTHTYSKNFAIFILPHKDCWNEPHSLSPLIQTPWY